MISLEQSMYNQINGVKVRTMLYQERDMRKEFYHTKSKMTSD